MQKRNNNTFSETRKTDSGLKKFWNDYAGTIFLTFALVSVFLLVFPLFVRDNNLPSDIAIILSSHFDDGALSMGGFMAARKNPVIVITFFAGKPANSIRGGWDTLSGFRNSDEAIATRTEENSKALKQLGTYPINLNYPDFQYRYDRTPVAEKQILQSIKKDIGTILDNFSGSKNVSIYGPAEFGPNITHSDHKLLHDAFSAIAREKIDRKNLRFFYYEDFPYVREYRASITTPLIKFLKQTNHDLTLREVFIPIDPNALGKKVKSIETYASQEKAFGTFGENIAKEAGTFTETRCQGNTAVKNPCEAVYEILPAK